MLPVAIVLDVTPEVAHERNASRPDRDFGPHVVRRQGNLLRRSMKHLQREGFRRVIVLRGQEEIDAAEIVREPAWTDRSTLHGPFDIIGDVHGCRDELETLLDVLGYAPDADGTLPAPRRAGRPCSSATWSTAARTRRRCSGWSCGWSPRAPALCVPGNHEQKLLRALRGRNVQITHGLAESLEQLDARDAASSATRSRRSSTAW